MKVKEVEKTKEVIAEIRNTEVTVGGNLATGIKTYLKNWKPSSKVDVVRMLSFISAVTNDTTVKRVKELSYNYLQNVCADCENAIDPEFGLEVSKVERETKVYNESPEILKIKGQIEKLKVKLAAAQEEAGVEKTIISTYYKVK